MNLNSLLVFARLKFDADVAHARLTRTAAPTFEQTLAACRAQIAAKLSGHDPAAVVAEPEAAPVASPAAEPEAIPDSAPVAEPETIPNSPSVAEPHSSLPRRRTTLRRRAGAALEPTVEESEPMTAAEPVADPAVPQESVAEGPSTEPPQAP